MKVGYAGRRYLIPVIVAVAGLVYKAEVAIAQEPIPINGSIVAKRDGAVLVELDPNSTIDPVPGEQVEFRNKIAGKEVMVGTGAVLQVLETAVWVDILSGRPGWSAAAVVLVTPPAAQAMGDWAGLQGEVRVIDPCSGHAEAISAGAGLLSTGNVNGWYERIAPALKSGCKNQILSLQLSKIASLVEELESAQARIAAMLQQSRQ